MVGLDLKDPLPGMGKRGAGPGKQHFAELGLMSRDLGWCRSAQTVLSAMLQGLMPLLAPILPHTAEDAFQALPFPSSHKSVFQVRYSSHQNARSVDSLPLSENMGLVLRLSCITNPLLACVIIAIRL